MLFISLCIRGIRTLPRVADVPDPAIRAGQSQVFRKLQCYFKDAICNFLTVYDSSNNAERLFLYQR